MSKQQTAVDWLYNQIPLEWTIKGSAKKIFEAALEMEKQQIIKAFNEGTFSEMEKIDSEDYYNQTYGLPS